METTMESIATYGAIETVMTIVSSLSHEGFDQLFAMLERENMVRELQRIHDAQHVTIESIVTNWE